MAVAARGTAGGWVGSLLVLVLAGCAGASELEACVQHSVDEGLSRDVAERACRDAGREG